MTNNHIPLSIIGAQWGDEGKGKLVDVVTEHADMVVRYNGGNNAGHTVVVKDKVFKLSLLPSGVAQKKHLVIAQGCVIDPNILLEEIRMVQRAGLPVRLSLDPRVHIVMPYHKALDRATEIAKGKTATGSLHLGIGYCYEDKNNRSGIRLDDLLHPLALKEKLTVMLALHTKRLHGVFGVTDTFDLSAILKTYIAYGKKLKPYIQDTSFLISRAINKKRIVFEGAHGTLLDPVFGTYPYTVAIHTLSGAIFPYVGIAPCPIHTLGIVKAYTTRVGNGPFPTEQKNAVGAHLQNNGHEFGTVSKRPRRCGWLDIPALKTATRLSGFTSLAITKLDVLSGLSTLSVCTAYTQGKNDFKELPASMYTYAACKPKYQTLKGWKQDISTCRSYAGLPKEAKAYVMFIKKALHVPISYISVGPKRSQIIVLSTKEGGL